MCFLPNIYIPRGWRFVHGKSNRKDRYG
jgi:uncharacterized protein YbdZ (MbtH family)